MLKAIYQLPFPPTINSYFAEYKGRRILSEKGRKYKREVNCAIREKGLVKFDDKFVGVNLKLFMPDKRVRDINNVIKALEDSLVYAGVIDDDVQIKEFHNFKPMYIKGGLAVVQIYEVEWREEWIP